MANSSEIDVLIDVKNAYFMGNFQQCINESQKLKGLTDEQKDTRDLYLYRAYIAQKKFSVVVDEITGESKPQLQSLKLLAEFLSTPSRRDVIIENLDKQISTGFDSNNVPLIIVAATIYQHNRSYESALRVLHQVENLECSALAVQALLAYDRADLARKELKNMQEKDEDAILTQLATVWVNLATIKTREVKTLLIYILTEGGEKYQEAFYIVQEMVDKYGSTPLLLNLLASCYIAQGKNTDADSVLQEALDKDPNNADTLINLFMNSSFVGKAAEVSNRYLSQLKDAHPNHNFVQEYYKKELEFDKVSSIFAAA